MKIPFHKRRPVNRRDILAERKEHSESSRPEFMYQRSRTISGSDSLPSSDSTDRMLVNQLRRQRHKLTVVLISIITSLCVVVVLLNQLAINLSVITPNTISAQDQSSYVSLLDKYFDDRPLERFLFVTNYDTLNSYLTELAPEIKTIQIEPKGIVSATVKLTFREPIIKWSIDGSQYYVDSDGVTFERNYFDEPEVVVNDQSGIPANPGQEVVNRPFMSFLGQSISKFLENGYVVNSVVLPPDTVRQAEFYLEERNYPIKMTLDRGVGAQVNQSIKAISFFDERGDSPAYIDVRVDQRVFYR